MTASLVKEQKKKELNKLLEQDRPAHDWYRFVLSFPPHLVRDYLHRFNIDQTKTVLDPFCGTGTTLVECKKMGIPSVGVEANPMACLASRVKTDWRPDPRILMKSALSVANTTLEILRKDGIEDEALPLLRPNGIRLERNSHSTIKSFSEECFNLILSDSISPLPLHKTLVLLDQIKRCSSRQILSHELLALAKAVVYKISNLRFGPEVGLGPVKRDVEVVSHWAAEVEKMVQDLQTLQGAAIVESTVLQGDARMIASLMEPKSIDAVITSPPYPNEKDYSRTTRLESVLLGLISSKDDIRAIKRNLVRSNTRSVYTTDDDDAYVQSHPEIQRIARAIEQRRLELGKTSGFERLYARVAKLYFGGMHRHLAELRKVLKPGAMLAYVVGDQASYLRVMIRTGQLLADLAKSLGLSLIHI